MSDTSYDFGMIGLGVMSRPAQGRTAPPEQFQDLADGGEPFGADVGAARLQTVGGLAQRLGVVRG